jgi:hypothetical protein
MWTLVYANTAGHSINQMIADTGRRLGVSINHLADITFSYVNS